MMRYGILALFASALLVSCGDSTTTPTTPDSYLASSAGSYFLHQNTVINIDTASKQTTDIPAPADSTVLGAAVTYNAMSSTPAYSYVGGVAADTTYYYQDGSTVYRSIPLEYNIGGIPLDLGSKWAKILDQSNSSWVALTDSIAPFDLPIGGYKMAAKLSFAGSKAGTENITIDGKTLSAVKVQIDLNATLYAMAGATSLPVPIQLKQFYWFVKDVGIVKMEQPAAIVNLGLLGTLMGSPVQAVPGSRQVTTKYVIK